MARRRSGKKIDFVHWLGAGFSFAGLGAGVSATTLFAAQHDPETLMRMRGNLIASLEGTQAPGVHVRIAVGLILVPEGTASTTLWSPITDSDAPWIWMEMFDLIYNEAVTDVIAYQGGGVFRATIDNKAMRIVRNQEVQAVFENVTVGGAGGVDVGGQVRALWGT